MEFKIDYALYPEGIPEEYRALCQAARATVKQAYSVYSHFSVGAALLLDNGEVVRGSNQENVAYPSGLCAERVALFYASSAFPGITVKALAVAAESEGREPEEPITPCGACRQVMAEVIRRQRRDFDVILIGRKSTLVVKAGDLLPFAFEIATNEP